MHLDHSASGLLLSVTSITRPARATQSKPRPSAFQCYQAHVMTQHVPTSGPLCISCSFHEFWQVHACHVFGHKSHPQCNALR